MALMPLISNFQGDFVLQLLPVDSELTMDEVASAAAYHSVGRRVKAQPEKIVRVRRQGKHEFLPREIRLSQTDIKPMECLEFIFTDAT